MRIASSAKISDDEGSAIIEFLAASLLLFVPIIYLVLTFAAVQASTYAAESAAREAGRIYARADSEHVAREQAQVATLLAFADHGIDVAPRQVLQVTCEAEPCATPGAGVHIEVRIDVPLPLVPDFIAARVPATVPVTATSYTTVDRFGG